MKYGQNEFRTMASHPIHTLTSSSEKEKESPAELTERCFRELLGRAAYGNIKNAVKPVLMHLDNHSLWEGKVFAVRCFKIIMYSIQSQHSHLVIQQLLGHLDANSKNAATVRAGIVEVLSEAAVIAASGSVACLLHPTVQPFAPREDGSLSRPLPGIKQQTKRRIVCITCCSTRVVRVSSAAQDQEAALVVVACNLSHSVLMPFW
ncbi:UNVERIFIED_CONTAM: hypothetical protein FKN15_004521 [Acipenser sinensis]